MSETPRDVTGLLAIYHQLSGQIAQHETEIAGLRHKQSLLISWMRLAGLSYREIAPMLGISKSRVQQLAPAAAEGKRYP